MAHLVRKIFYRLPTPRLKFPLPPSLMTRNTVRADDVSWLLRTIKMPHCIALGFSNQAKNRKDTGTSFHVFPKDNRLRRAWIQAVGRQMTEIFGYGVHFWKTTIFFSLGEIS